MPHDPHHSHGHAHGLTRSEETRGVSDARLLWSIALNQLLTLAEAVAGVLSGSVALLSDAAHNFNDANALLIAYIARRVSRKPANERYTFGYRRAELIGAVINLTLLAAIGMYLVYEAIERLFEPREIVGWLMAAAAGLALVIDVATALLLWSMSRGSLNVRAAFVHNLVDAAGSVAVLLAAAAVTWLGWTWIDPALTLLIAGYILWQVRVMLPRAVRILMEATPDGMDVAAVVEALRRVEPVRGVHHVHAWQLDEHHRALEAHVVIPPDAAGEMEAIKRRLKTLLRDRFDIAHATLEFDLGHPDEADHSEDVIPGH